MKKIITSILAGLTLMLCLNSVYAAEVITAAQQKAMTPKEVLQKLIIGNDRFVQDELNKRDHTLILQYNVKGQHPVAFVFNCVDSRSVPELLFDQVPGNIFVGRIAGNVVDYNVLGSMEFATEFAGAKLIVVMGHTACGAVQGACNNVKAGNLTGLLAQIQPAINKIKSEEKSKFSCKNPKTIDAIAKQNVFNQMHYILNNSKIIANLEKKKKVMLVGAIHNLATGKVEFFTINGKKLS